MAEETTKVYTTSDNGFSDGAMMGALLGGNKNSDNSGMWAALANCNNRNQMWDNPFAYLIFLMFAQNMNGGWGSNGNNGMAMANNQQLQTIQTQLQDNHNSDLIMNAMKGNSDAIAQLSALLGTTASQLQMAINGVQNAIINANGDIKLAAERMIANQNQQTGIIGSQMQNGFCGVKTAILEQGYQTQLGNERQTNQIQLGFNQIQNSFTNGFTGIGYQLQQGFNNISQNECNQTQKIIDVLNDHWSQEQQTEIATLKTKVNTMEQTQVFTNQYSQVMQAIQALANAQTAARTTNQAAG